MTIDDLPEYVTLDELEAHGITRDDLLRLCPGVVEYGSRRAPYYHRDDPPGSASLERGTKP